MSFDAKKAEVLLREVFLTREIATALMVDENEVNEVVNAEVIEQVQKERMENLDEIKKFKSELETLFPNYRFSARLKSLPSIFGKMLRHRTIADVYGMKIVVPTIADCYKLKDWFLKRYEQFVFKDKIVKPKPNGYRDLKLVIHYVLASGETVLVEFIIQTPEMYVDSHTIQKHSNVYPWKYHDVIKNLPAEYEYVEF